MLERSSRRVVLLAASGLLVLASAAWSQDAAAPCADDEARLCADAGPTRGAKSRCLKEHTEDLSDGCKALLGEAQQRRADAGDACGDDAVRLCHDAQPGRNNTGMLTCLRANAPSLSEECRNAIDALPGKKREGAASM